MLARVVVSGFEHTVVHTIPTVSQGCRELSKQFAFLQTQKIWDLFENSPVRFVVPQVRKLIEHEGAPADVTSLAASNRVRLTRCTGVEDVATRERGDVQRAEVAADVG
jgi:hypothetical protein